MKEKQTVVTDTDPADEITEPTAEDLILLDPT